MNSDLKREIILDNYQNPMNRGLVDDDSYLKKNTNNESCIDNIDMMMKIENGIVTDVVFDGEACAISTSATSILIRRIINKPVTEVKEVLENYRNMIEEKEYNKDILGELNVYDDIGKQANRKKCALLPMEAVEKMLGELSNEK